VEIQDEKGAQSSTSGMSQSLNPSDDDLLRRLRAGDGEAFAALYERRQGSVFRFALRMTGRPAVAEDVTQEVFMVLVHEAQAYDPERGSLLPYLIGIARKKVLRHLGREAPYAGGDGTVVEQTAPDDPFLDLSRAEIVRRVRKAVQDLPTPFREAVVLCDLEGLAYSDAAKALDCPIGTVRSRLHRGRHELQRKLRSREGARASASDLAVTR
jgi:RNA polymerase sigma-70 factor (ECF subfamily)